MMCPRPHERAEVELVDAGLLQKLASYRLFVGFRIRRSAPWSSPDEPIAEVEADEEDAVVLVEHERPRRDSQARLGHETILPKRTEPAEALVPGHSRVRR